jgi:hypothetical protein
MSIRRSLCEWSWSVKNSTAAWWYGPGVGPSDSGCCARPRPHLLAIDSAHCLTASSVVGSSHYPARNRHARVYPDLHGRSYADTSHLSTPRIATAGHPRAITTGEQFPHCLLTDLLTRGVDRRSQAGSSEPDSTLSEGCSWRHGRGRTGDQHLLIRRLAGTDGTMTTRDDSAAPFDSPQAALSPWSRPDTEVPVAAWKLVQVPDATESFGERVDPRREGPCVRR